MHHRVFSLPVMTVLAMLFLHTAAADEKCAIPSADAATFDVRQYGAVGDGKTDDTAAFQKALDAAGANHGGIVRAGVGNYYFAGHLAVPTGVTLAGVWQSVPAHNGIRDAGTPKPTDDGTTFLVTENAGQENAPAFITLNTNSTLRGVVIYYPNQKADDEPTAYPWAVAMRGKNPAVLAVELLNSYNGIDASGNERHLIRDVHGQPLRRGIFVDGVADIGRIENVHFNPWWSMQPKLFQWQMDHGEAFVIGRSDWQYVFNTFCFGYHVGYRFISTPSGACNGNIQGVGADDCQTSIVIESTQEPGLLITNGEFVSFHGPDPTMVAVTPSHAGVARFVNCAFWGPCNQIARIAGTGTVGFSDCNFVQWGGQNGDRAAIQAAGGHIIVNGCDFRQDRPQIELSPEVNRAIITDNLFKGATRITNHSAGKVLIDRNLDESK